MEEPIKQLLSMGWTCDDLLAKLQEFKKKQAGNVVENGKESEEESRASTNGLDCVEGGVKEGEGRLEVTSDSVGKEKKENDVGVALDESIKGELNLDRKAINGKETVVEVSSAGSELGMNFEVEVVEEDDLSKENSLHEQSVEASNIDKVVQIEDASTEVPASNKEVEFVKEDSLSKKNSIHEESVETANSDNAVQIEVASTEVPASNEEVGVVEEDALSKKNSIQEESVEASNIQINKAVQIEDASTEVAASNKEVEVFKEVSLSKKNSIHEESVEASNVSCEHTNDESDSNQNSQIQIDNAVQIEDASTEVPAGNVEIVEENIDISDTIEIIPNGFCETSTDKEEIVPEQALTQQSDQPTVTLNGSQNLLNESESETRSLSEESQITEDSSCNGDKSEDESLFKKPSLDLLEKVKRKFGEIVEYKEPEPKQDVEVVRNKIREQLQLLRTRKKTEIPISGKSSREILSRPILETWKKKPTPATLAKPKGTETSKAVNPIPTNDLSDKVLSNEDSLLIVDVIGGYKSPTHSDAEEETEKCIKLTKTTDITKIKGWRHKKFILPKKNSPEPAPIQHTLEPTPSCSKTEDTIISIEPETKANKPSDPKSAFVSNALDEFLTEHSQLNISYEVPKLEAEHAIKHDHLDTSVPPNVPTVTQPKQTEETNNDPEKLLVVKAEEVYKPKTLAEKRRMLESSWKKRAREMEPEEEDSVKFGYIYHSGKKLKVATKGTSNKIRYLKKPKAVKKSYVYVPTKQESKSKPSLLTCLKKDEDVCKVTYKPGPLSRKQFLQDPETKGKWVTVLKKLPRVVLEVKPQFMKALDPRVAGFVDFTESIIDEKRVRFALTALKSANEENSEKFEFDVPFASNQTHLLLRQKVNPEIEATTVTIEDDEQDTETVVKDVVNKLINYIETSEIAESLIQEDTDFTTEKIDRELPKPPSDISKKVGAIIKNRKRGKTCLELKRLNVKIIDVDVAQKDDDSDRNCDKPYCTMGCVCKSLKCNGSVIPLHCGQLECMLKCNCNFESRHHLSEEDKMMLPAGTDLFSTGTMNLLQKEAKKNLAKVEKEFTQTVIQANDQTIILGTGNRERQKRAKKTPRKYSDFVDESEIEVTLDPPEEIKVETLFEKIKREMIEKKCFVKLPKQDFDDLLPLCLNHNKYNCSCINDIQPHSVTKIPEDTSLEIITRAVETSQTERKRRNTNLCARSKEIPTEEYRRRNSHPDYLKKLKKILKRKENWPNRSWNYRRDETLDNPTRIVSNETKRRRKQMFVESRAEKDLDSPTSIIDVTDESDTRTVLEAKKPSDSTIRRVAFLKPSEPLLKEIQKLVGNNSIDQDQWTLIPWKELLANYIANKLYIWLCMKFSKLIVTETNERPSKRYVNINLFEQLEDKSPIQVDIVKWLVTKKMPGTKNSDDVLVVLIHRMNCWQICGICNKKGAAPTDPISPPKASVEEKERNIPAGATIVEDDGCCQGGLFTHKDLQEKTFYTPVYKKSFETVYLKQSNWVEEQMKEILHVSLPKISSDKRWLLVRLSPSLSYLLFTKTKYTISSLDLIRLSQLSIDHRKTIIFSSIFREIYSSSNFAIYFVPNHQNTFFVGPFTKAEMASLGVKALARSDRVRSGLQKMSMFTVHRGSKESFGCWLKQIEFKIPVNISGSDAIEIIPKFGPVIDLTSNESDEDRETICKPIENNSNRSLLKSSMKRKPETDVAVSQPEEKKRKTDEDEVEVAILNESKLEKARIRYMVTNVPKLGYIEAYQFPDSKIIDVRWPIGKHIQRFSKPSNAIQMLESDLPKILLPVPSSFKIQVKVVSELKPDWNKPFDTKYMKGNHIVGEFGVMEIGKVTLPFLNKLGLSDDKARELILVKSKKVLYDQCSKLAEMLGPSNGEQFKKASEIIDRAVIEIRKQEELYRQLDKDKLALEVERSNLLRTCFNLMKKQEKDEQKVKMELYNLIKPHGLQQYVKLLSDQDFLLKSPKEPKPKETIKTIEIGSPPRLVPISSKSNIIEITTQPITITNERPPKPTTEPNLSPKTSSEIEIEIIKSGEDTNKGLITVRKDLEVPKLEVKVKPSTQAVSQQNSLVKPVQVFRKILPAPDPSLQITTTPIQSLQKPVTVLNGHIGNAKKSSEVRAFQKIQIPQTAGKIMLRSGVIPTKVVGKDNKVKKYILVKRVDPTKKGLVNVKYVKDDQVKLMQLKIAGEATKE